MNNKTITYLLICVTALMITVIFPIEGFAWSKTNTHQSYQFDRYGNILPLNGIYRDSYITGDLHVFQPQGASENELSVEILLLEVAPNGKKMPRRNAGILKIRFYENNIPYGTLKSPDKTFKVKHGAVSKIRVPDNSSVVYFTLELKELAGKSIAFTKVIR